MKFGSLCALGGFTPYPVMSALTHFPEDFGAARRACRPPNEETRRCPSLHEIDYGTPRSQVGEDGHADHRRHARSPCRKAPRSCARRWRSAPRSRSSARPTCSSLRLLPPVSGRDRGRHGHAGFLHDAGRRGMMVHTQTDRLQAAAQGRDGALHLRPSARLPDLRGQRRLRIAGHGRRRRACATCATATTARTISTGAKDESNPYFTYDPSKCIVCSRCVRACEEVQGTFALTIAGRGFDVAWSRRAWTSRSSSSECVSCGACVQACPTATLIEKIGDRDRHSPNIRWSRPAPIAASAAPSRRRCAARRWCAWCRTRTARPITAIPASRAASPGATPPTRTASSSR